MGSIAIQPMSSARFVKRRDYDCIAEVAPGKSSLLECVLCQTLFFDGTETKEIEDRKRSSLGYDYRQPKAHAFCEGPSRQADWRGGGAHAGTPTGGVGHSPLP